MDSGPSTPVRSAAPPSRGTERDAWSGPRSDSAEPRSCRSPSPAGDVGPRAATEHRDFPSHPTPSRKPGRRGTWAREPRPQTLSPGGRLGTEAWAPSREHLLPPTCAPRSPQCQAPRGATSPRSRRTPGPHLRLGDPVPPQLHHGEVALAQRALDVVEPHPDRPALQVPRAIRHDHAGPPLQDTATGTRTNGPARSGAERAGGRRAARLRSGRRPRLSLGRCFPPAPQGPARRAPALTCADVRGPGQGAGAGLHRSPWLPRQRRRRWRAGSRREGRRAGRPGRVLPAAEPSSAFSSLAAAGGGGAVRSAPLCPVPPLLPCSRRARASPGGLCGGCTERPVRLRQGRPALSPGPRPFPPKPLPPWTCAKFGAPWLSNALLTAFLLCVLFSPLSRHYMSLCLSTF